MPFHLWAEDEPSSPMSRRTFLAGVAASGVSAVLAGQLRAAEPSPWYALLSDTHIAEDPARKSRDHVMADELKRATDGVLSQATRPGGLLINGDLALLDGQLGDYKTFRTLLEPFRAAKVPVHLALGNHDDRVHMREIAANIAGKSEPTKKAAPAEKYVSVVNTAGPRWVVLDSLDSVNVTPGRIGKAQLDWVSATLDESPDTPTFVFMHHNPSSTNSSLLDTTELLAILRPRRQVKAVFFGHTHVWDVTQTEELYLVNLPAVAYPFAADQPIGWVGWHPQDASGGVLKLHAIGGKRSYDGEELPLRFRNM